MNMQKFVIGLIVGIFLATGAWYFLRAPKLSERESSTAAPISAPTATPAYAPTTPPHVTPPTTPPPTY